jgi:hypothetical protein
MFYEDKGNQTEFGASFLRSGRNDPLWGTARECVRDFVVILGKKMSTNADIIRPADTNRLADIIRPADTEGPADTERPADIVRRTTSAKPINEFPASGRRSSPSLLRGVHRRLNKQNAGPITGRRFYKRSQVMDRRRHPYGPCG